MCTLGTAVTPEPGTVRESSLPAPFGDPHELPTRPRTTSRFPGDSSRANGPPDPAVSVSSAGTSPGLFTAAPWGSRNRAPRAVPGYEATSQQSSLHVLLQLQTLFREQALGRTGGLRAGEVLGLCRQLRHHTLPLSPPRMSGTQNNHTLLRTSIPEREHLPAACFNLVIPKYGILRLQIHTLLQYQLAVKCRQAQGITSEQSAAEPHAAASSRTPPAPGGAAWPRLQPRARWGRQLPTTPWPPPQGLPRGSGRPLMLGGPRGAGADPDSSDSGSELPSAILGQVPRLPAVVKPGMC